MGYNYRLLLVASLSLVGLVLWHSKIGSAQEAPKVDSARDTSDQPKAALVWDAATSDDVRTLKGHTNGVFSAAFFQGGERVVTGGADNTARVWDTLTGKELVKIDKTGFNGCYASISADGSRILTTNIPYVKLWDAKTGRELLDLTSQVGLEKCWPFPFAGAISPDAKLLVTASPHVRVVEMNLFNLKIRDAKTGDDLLTLPGHGYWPNCSAFSPDSSRLVTGCQVADDTAKVWDSKTGAELLALKGHGGAVWSVCFSRDGQQVATGGVNGKVRIWNAKSGDELLTLVGHSKVVSAISFSSDGKRILTGSQDDTAQIWDTKKGTELFVLKGHAKIVTSAQFSPDGNHIVTASWDKTARLWDFRRFLETGAPDAKDTTLPQPK